MQILEQFLFLWRHHWYLDKSCINCRNNFWHPSKYGLKDLFLIYICMRVCLHACMCTTCLECTQRPKKGVGSLRTGVKDGREPPRGCWNQTQQLFLRVEPSLQACFFSTSYQYFAVSGGGEAYSRAVYIIGWVGRPGEAKEHPTGVDSLFLYMSPGDQAQVTWLGGKGLDPMNPSYWC